MVAAIVGTLGIGSVILFGQRAVVSWARHSQPLATEQLAAHATSGSDRIGSASGKYPAARSGAAVAPEASSFSVAAPPFAALNDSAATGALTMSLPPGEQVSVEAGKALVSSVPALENPAPVTSALAISVAATPNLDPAVSAAQAPETPAMVAAVAAPSLAVARATEPTPGAENVAVSSQTRGKTPKTAAIVRPPNADRPATCAAEGPRVEPDPPRAASVGITVAQPAQPAVSPTPRYVPAVNR